MQEFEGLLHGIYNAGVWWGWALGIAAAGTFLSVWGGAFYAFARTMLWLRFFADKNELKEKFKAPDDEFKAYLFAKFSKHLNLTHLGYKIGVVFVYGLEFAWLNPGGMFPYEFWTRDYLSGALDALLTVLWYYLWGGKGTGKRLRQKLKEKIERFGDRLIVRPVTE